MKQFKIIFLIILIFLYACDVKPKESSGSPSDNVAFVVTTDYSIGSFSTIGIDSQYVYSDIGLGKVHSDARARYYNGLVYIVNMKGRDNIQVLDPLQNFATIGEFSTGQNSNPHDIVVVSADKAYVSRYGNSSLLIMNPATGIHTAEIDLSMYAANSSGVPHMSRMYLYNNSLFVALQRLDDNWYPSGYSSVVVIDTASDTVIKEIQLQWTTAIGETVSAQNPYSAFRFVSRGLWQPAVADNHDHLFISCPGEFGHMYKEDGGIVAIDPEDLAVEAGYLIEENTIHAEITDFILDTNGGGYIVTLHEDLSSSLYKFELNSGSIVKTIRHSADATGPLWSLALHDSGRLYVCDRNILDPGVRVYSTFDNDLPLNNDKPLNTGLQPFEVIFIQ